ncbi:histidine triad nucleotide-binding protein [Algiphilus sp.]|uniref:histidine triad nucleotide-binding protein n=1 Tax=Algiphilus sp. TaxID=1872431 RepID=UPI003B515583
MSEASEGKTLFQKIIDRDIPGTIVYEDDHCAAFRDINPGAPTHILVVPRKPIPRLVDASDDDQALLGHLMRTAAKVAQDEGVGDAFRLVINNGADVGQTVFHLHLHVLAGREFQWPPG